VLESDLAAAELARLKAERAHFVLGAQVLRLEPGRPVDLQDLQEAVRRQARDLVSDLTPPPQAGESAHAQR
jgi:hypothetical protein